MNYADVTSIINILAGIVGAIFKMLDAMVITTIGIVDITLLDILVVALYLYAIVGFFNWLRGLGGSSDDGEREYGPARPKVHNTKTGKVYWK